MNRSLLNEIEAMERPLRFDGARVVSVCQLDDGSYLVRSEDKGMRTRTPERAARIARAWANRDE